MGRKPCCEKVGLKRGPWTAEEDQKLVSYITANGICCWRAIPKLAGLLRCGKSCRLRWTNYLRPDLKRGIFTEEEEDLILDLHATLGNRWSRIAAQLPGRTDNEIKNYWNTRLKKRLRSQGLDPATHQPLDAIKSEDGAVEDVDGDLSDAKKPPAKPERQPRGPKPQLKLCQSKDGPVLLKVPKPPKLDSDSDLDLSPSPSSCSTVTTKSGPDDQLDSSLARRLTSAPSYPEAELWKCIKPSASLSTAALLDEWDSCALLNPFPAKPAELSKPVDMIPGFSTQNFSGLFQASCFPHIEMGAPWSMDVEMVQPAPESLFAPLSVPANPCTRQLQPQPSHDLQKLAALLDLI